MSRLNPLSARRRWGTATVLSAALIGSTLAPVAAAPPNVSGPGKAPTPVVTSSVSPTAGGVNSTFTVTNSMTTPYTGQSNAVMETSIPPGARFKKVQTPVPDGWDLEYSINGGGSWSLVPPVDPSKVTNVRAKGTAKDTRAQGQTLNPPQPIGVLNIAGGGDGFNPQFYKDQIWVANHHAKASDGWLRCFNRMDGKPCAGFPAAANGGKYISAVPGTPFGQGAATLTTTNESVAFINQTTGKIYVPVQVSGSGNTSVGWVCGDLNKQESCGFTAAGSEKAPVEPSATSVWPSVLSTQIWARKKDAGIQYMIGGSGTVYCFNVGTGALCPRNAQSSLDVGFQYNVGTSAIMYLPFAAVSGSTLSADRATYAWLIAPTGTNTSKFACVNILTGAKCFNAISPPAFPGYTGTSPGIPTPMYATNGDFSAMCLQLAAADVNKPVVWNFKCYNASGVDVPGAATALTNTVKTAAAVPGTIDAPLMGSMLDTNWADNNYYYARSFQSVP